MRAAAYFVSHCWENKWEHFDKLYQLVGRIEDKTRERVWFDKFELAEAQDFGAMVE